MVVMVPQDELVPYRNGDNCARIPGSGNSQRRQVRQASAADGRLSELGSTMFLMRTSRAPCAFQSTRRRLRSSKSSGRSGCSNSQPLHSLSARQPSYSPALPCTKKPVFHYLLQFVDCDILLQQITERTANNCL